MANKFDSEMLKRFGLEETAKPEQVKAAYAKRMEEAKGLLAEADDPQKLLGEAARLEAEAQAYESAKFDGDEPGKEPHVVMRKLASRFRRFAGLPEPEAAPAVAGPVAAEAAPFAGAETPEEEKKEAEQLQKLAVKFGLDPVRATRAQILGAATAGSVPAASMPALVQAEVDKRMKMEADKQERVQAVTLATDLASRACRAGYPVDQKDDLISFATNNLASAEKLVKPFLDKDAELMGRVTFSGAPSGAGASAARPQGTGQPQVKIVNGVGVVKMGQGLSQAARAKVAAAKSAGKPLAYEAALDEVRAEKPELWEQYQQEQANS